MNLKKLKVELPHNPAIPLLDICPKKLQARTLRDIYTHMFIAALFTIEKKVEIAKYVDG